jgi:16S rRNA (guanine1207-N2)-methyltransferase
MAFLQLGKEFMVYLSYLGISFAFDTHPSLFSPSSVDAGTLAMLSCADFTKPVRVIDLGCGYGVVGIIAAKLLGSRHVVMLDNDDMAIACSKRNAVLNSIEDIAILKSDGYSALDDAGYDLILCNPPYHADFSVAKTFIEKGFNRLSVGGKLLMVTKRRTWYERKLTAIFGGVRVHEIDGYYVFEAEKRRSRYADKKLPKQEDIE